MDFDDWDDVGLNVPQPPNLLRLYRDFDKHVVPSAVNTLAKMEEEKSKLESICQKLKEELEKLHEENKTKEETIKVAEERLDNQKQENVELKNQVKCLTEELEERKLHFANASMEQPMKNLEINELPCNEPQTVGLLDDKSNDSGVGLSDSVQNGSHTPEVEEYPANEEKTLLNTSQVPEVNLCETEEKRSIEINSDNVTSRRMCPAFKQALLNIAQLQHDSRVANEVTRLAKTEDSAVLVLSRCLPHIVPNVLLNKREELLPVILCTAIHHAEEKERDKLLHLLVNLIKRPDAEQRRMIISGCSAFAHCVGHVRTEAELLPQLWEQINHKYPERRQLVAEACGALSQYLPVEIVSSLLLSMLKQMFAEDRNDSVRETVIKSLALAMTVVDSPSKYKEAEQLLLQSLCDDSEKVREATINILLPSVLAWAHELDKLQSDLLELFLRQLELTLKDFIHIEEQKEEGNDELDSTMAVISARLLLYVRALTSSFPALMVDILSRAPFQEECDNLEPQTTLPAGRLNQPSSPLTDIAVMFESAGRLANYLDYFDRWLENEETQTFWESLSWVVTKYVTRIYSLLGQIHYVQVHWIEGFSELFRSLCIVFGHVFTVNRLEPFFGNELRSVLLDEQISSDEEKEQILSSAIIPVYLLGVLTSYSQENDQARVKSFLKDVLTHLSSPSKDARCLYFVCEKLSAEKIWCDVLLLTLWDILTHADPLVRSIVPYILQTMIKNLDKTAIMKRVLPALVTLSTDNDKSVRISTVPAFGAIVEHISDDEMLEKIHIQFQSFLGDPSYYDQHELQVALIRTFGKIGPHSEPRFRDEFLHPKLTELVLRNSRAEDETKKTEVAIALLEAYASLTCCFISEDILRNNTLPGLMYLKQDLETLAPEYEETITVLMKDCEDKLVSQKTSGPSPTTGKVHEEVKRAFLNKFHKLKEVSPKPKMADIFRKKSRTDSEKSA